MQITILIHLLNSILLLIYAGVFLSRVFFIIIINDMSICVTIYLLLSYEIKDFHLIILYCFIN